MRNINLILCFIFLFTIEFNSIIRAQTYDVPFYDGVLNEDIPTPDEVIGFRLGDKPARYTEIVDYIKNTVSKQTKDIEYSEAFRFMDVYQVT